MAATELLSTVPMEDYDAFLQVSLEVEEAAKTLDLEPWVVQRLTHAEREITVNLPLVCDNGQARMFTAFRVQHSTVCGPAMGGVCFAPDAHLAQIKAVAMEKTLQLALLGIPFGGSAGAIVCHPAELSERELRHVTKAYVHALRGLLGPHSDVLMPDAGVNPTIIGWLLDAYAHLAGRLEPAAVTSKPEALFGLADHGEATADGIVCLIEEMCAQRKLSVSSTRIAIQGFEQLGRSLARRLSEQGARVVALADSSGGLLGESGLDICALEQWANEHGMLLGYPDGDTASNAEVLESDCDVLILAAMERQITLNNAPRVRASIIVEGVFDAVTAAASQALETKRVVVVPAVLATGGSSALAYLEWTLNTSGRLLLAGEAEDHLRRRMVHGYRAARAGVTRHGKTLRKAAYLAAVEGVASALRMR